MAGPRTSFWRYLYPEQRVRLLALGLLVALVLALASGIVVPGDLVVWLLLGLGAYVIVLEVVCLSLAYATGGAAGSLLGAFILWGIEHAPVLRWVILAAFAAMILYSSAGLLGG